MTEKDDGTMNGYRNMETGETEGKEGKMYRDIGGRDGKLRRVPRKWNCVCLYVICILFHVFIGFCIPYEYWVYVQFTRYFI
jgi:hypothetical protein